MEFLQFRDQHRGSFSRIPAAGWSFSYAPANRSWSGPLQNLGSGAPMSTICRTFFKSLLREHVSEHVSSICHNSPSDLHILRLSMSQISWGQSRSSSFTRYHLSCIIHHQTPIMNHLSSNTYHASPLIHHLSFIISHLASIIYHRAPIIQQLSSLFISISISISILIILQPSALSSQPSSHIPHPSAFSP